MAYISKDFLNVPEAQRGGFSNFPASGVVSGAELTLTGTGIDTDTSVATVTVNAGKVRYDGYLVEFDTINATLQTEYDLSTDDAVLEIFLNPVRKVPLFTTTAPDPAGFEEGDYAIKATLNSYGEEYPEYYVTDDIFIKENGLWRKQIPFKGKDFKISYGHNNMSYNMIDQTAEPLVEARPEIPVFFGTKTPPHMVKQLMMMRQTNSIQLGEITYSGGVATITKGLSSDNVAII